MYGDHPLFDKIVVSIAEASRYAANPQKHNLAVRHLKDAVDTAGQFAKYLYTVDGADVSNKFKAEFGLHVDRLVNMIARHGGPKLNPDAFKKSEGCRHELLKANEKCAGCSLVQKSLSHEQAQAVELAKSISEFQKGIDPKLALDLRVGELHRRLEKAKIIDFKSRKVLADLPSPDAGNKPPHGDLTIQDVRGYPAEQNALRHHLKHMAEHYHSWQNYEGAAAAVSNSVHKKRNLAQAEKHKIAHQTHLNWARGEHSRLKGLPPVHIMERNALEQQEYKSGAMVDKFTPHPDDTKPRPKLVKSEPLDKAKIVDFKTREVLADLPGEPTPRTAAGGVHSKETGLTGQIMPGTIDQMHAAVRGTDVPEPKRLGKINGIKILHAVDDSHRSRTGLHLNNPSVEDFASGLEDAANKGHDTIYIHGSRPSDKAIKSFMTKKKLRKALTEVKEKLEKGDVIDASGLFGKKPKKAQKTPEEKLPPAPTKDAGKQIGKFKVGDVAFHSSHGPGRISGIEEREIDGTKHRFIEFHIQDGGSPKKLYIPEQNAEQRLKPGMSKEEGEKLHAYVKETLGGPSKIDHQTWNRRYRDYMENISSGDPYKAADVFASLQHVRREKDLSFGERKLADQAKNLIHAHVGLSTGRTPEQMDEEYEAAFSGVKKSEDLEKQHIGFDRLVEKLKAKGHSEESAKKIAASVGRKKYGPGMNKSEDLDKVVDPNKIIGYTRSGKPIHLQTSHPSHSDWSQEDYGDAVALASHRLRNPGAREQVLQVGEYNRDTGTTEMKPHVGAEEKLDKGDLVDLKTRKVLSSTPTETTARESQPIVRDGEKGITNRQHLKETFSPDIMPEEKSVPGGHENSGKCHECGGLGGHKSECQTGLKNPKTGASTADYKPKDGLKKSLELMKAKVFSLQGKFLADTKTGEVTPEGKEHYGSKKFAQAMKQQAVDNDDSPAGMIGKLKARFHPDNDKAILSFIDAHQKHGHDEPYVGGAVDNVAWRSIEADKNPKVKNKARWNEPMPFPVHPDKVQLGGVLGKRVPQGGADAFAWMDKKYGMTKEILRRHKHQDLEIHTRSDLIGHDDYMEHLTPGKHKIHMHVLGMGDYNDHHQRNLEPGAASDKRRIIAAKRLQDAGHDVRIVHDKIPGLNEHAEAHIRNTMQAEGMQHDTPIQTNQVQLTDQAKQRIKKIGYGDYKESQPWGGLKLIKPE